MSENIQTLPNEMMIAIDATLTETKNYILKGISLRIQQIKNDINLSNFERKLRINELSNILNLVNSLNFDTIVD